MAVKIQLRGDTKANWLLTNPVISEREIVLETDTGKYKIGDGVAHYVDISYHGIDGKPSRITADGFWEIYSPATDTYGKTEYKALGVDGKSAFELWQAIEGNADKTLDDYFAAQKGDKGDPFKYTDFTEEQLDSLKVKGDKGDAFLYADFTPEQLDGLKLKFTALTDEDKAALKGDKGDPFEYADFTPEQIISLTGKSAYEIWKAQPGNEDKTVEEYLIAIKGQDGQSAYLDAVAKGYAGTKDEFDTLLAGIGVGGGGYLDITPLFDSSGPVANVTQEYLDTIKAAYDKHVTSCYCQTYTLPLLIAVTPELVFLSFGINAVGEGGMSYVQVTFEISVSDLSVKAFEGDLNFVSTGDGTKALMDDGAYKPVISPTDIVTLTSLSTLSNTKYSQKYTYTSTTAQGINFASTPEEGFECMLDIKNGTSSQITQAIPNAAAWQCDETSLVIPAGKVGCISIRYVHGKYCVRVGL